MPTVYFRWCQTGQFTALTAVLSWCCITMNITCAGGNVQFSEINTDCPENPERCEFIEIRNHDCSEYMFGSWGRGPFILGVSTGHKLKDGETVQYPVVRFLLELTSVAAKKRNHEYFTVCSDSYECDAKFSSVEQFKRPVHHRPGHSRGSYLENGNEYPMVLFLFTHTNAITVYHELAPYSPTSIQSMDRFTPEKMEFVKRSLRDVVVYGRRTPCQGCRWLENMIHELKPIRSDAVYASISYVQREFDHDGYPDMSLNRCSNSNAYVLATPTPGTVNKCHKHPTLLLQPTNDVYTWLTQHIDRYNKKRKHIPTSSDNEKSDCYITWFSLLYSGLRPADIARKRAQLIDAAQPLQHNRVKRSDREDHDESCFANSPDKKKLRPTVCSQDPNIVAEVTNKCIVHVMKSVKEIKSYPPLTDCPRSTSTHEGELIPLSNFDDSFDVPSDADDIRDGMNAGTESTADILLSRSGFFNGNSHNLNAMKICRHHSEIYGNGFKRYLMKSPGVMRTMVHGRMVIKCIMPTIAGIDIHNHIIPVQKTLTISKQQSEAIFRTQGILIPVGLPVCRAHYTAADNILIEYAELERAATPEAAHAYNIRERSAICYTEGSSQEGIPVICRTDAEAYISSQEICLIPYTESPTEKSRRLLKVFQTEKLVTDWHCTDKYTSLSDRTKKNYIRTYKSASRVLLNTLVGDAWRQLQSDVISSSEETWNRGDTTISTILDEINLLYNAVDNQESRYLILGIAALNVPFRTLSEKVGGISHYTFTKARALVRWYVHVKSPPPKPPKLKTVDRAKVEFFITYVIDNSTPKPWGSKLRKLSCGQKIELPPFLSVIRPKKIITEFLSYADQSLNSKDRENLVFKAHSTYYAILKKLPIEYRKAATGLDYKTNKGLEAFDTLQTVLCELNEMEVIDSDTLDKMKFDLNESKRYLRGDYKYHVATTSTVADHDIQFALSDPSDKRLQVPVSENHDNYCQRCELIKLIGKAIRNAVNDAEIEPPRKKELMILDVDSALTDIEEMKHHRMRSVHQNSAKTKVLQDLGPTQAFITGDFAQKFLPASGREDQTSYFGKKAYRGTSTTS